MLAILTKMTLTQVCGSIDQINQSDQITCLITVLVNKHDLHAPKSLITLHLRITNPIKFLCTYACSPVQNQEFRPILHVFDVYNNRIDRNKSVGTIDLIGILTSYM